MSSPPKSHHYKSLLNFAQVCNIGILTMFVLSIDGLVAQLQIPSVRVKACILTDTTAYDSFVCVCKSLKVSCVSNNPALAAVPTDMMNSVQEINLTHNAIYRIEENDFIGMEFVEKISLEDNKITVIHENAFRNMYKLTELNLKNNNFGQLDPSGRTFQHLASLTTLYLQHSEIYEINKYSFLSIFAPGKKVSVYWDENYIRCDCNYWAIKLWLNSNSKYESMQMLDFQCKNKEQKKLSDETDYSGCQSNKSSIFSSNITCPVCHGQRTNHGCRLQGVRGCTRFQVCDRTVEWNASTKTMSISSGCGNYSKCWTDEAKNKDTCGIDYQTNENVKCSFCCRGQSCGKDHLEGRTKDFTFYVGYERIYSDELSDKGSPQFLAEESRIDSEIRRTISNLKGGIDVYIHSISRKYPDNIQIYLRLEVTTFNIAEEKSVEDNITASLLKSIEDLDSFLHGENIEDQLIINFQAKDSNLCPKSVTYSLDKGVIIWDESTEGSYSAPCPYNNKNEVFTAHRRCVERNDNVVWSEVDYSSCHSKKEQEYPTPENIFNLTISLENAQEVSNILKNYTKSLDNLTVEAMSNIVQILGQLVNETILNLPGVALNLVDCLSNLINIDQEMLLALDMNVSTSERLLSMIDYISEKAPMLAGKLLLVVPNLAIAAQEVNASETRNVALTVNSDFVGGFSNGMITVDFSNGNNSQHKGSNKMVIPTKAIIDSMATGSNINQSVNISRVSFVVHQTDRLFIVKHKIRGGLQTNNTQIYECDKNNSNDCQRENPVLSRINSHVIASSVPQVVVQNLTENITITFVHNDTNGKNHRCVFWNKLLNNGTGDWSDEGCTTVESVSGSGNTTCTCNHLTNFALFMDIYQGGSTLTEHDRKALAIISYVGCGISFIALLLTLLTYSLFRKLRRDNPSKILINLCLALMLSNLVYLIGMHDYTFDNTASCKAMAVLMHYFLLSSLTWMAVEAFYMYLALVLVFKTYFTNFILKCSLVGWGVPLVIVAITLGINATDNYGFINSGLCWLRNPAFFAAFVGPVCLILLVNCIAFGLVIRQLINMSSTKLNKTDRNGTIQRLRGAVGVVILLGLAWLFAIFAIGQASVVFYYLFAIFNSLQGLFIFIFYCILKKDAVISWKRSLPCFEEYGEASKSSSNSRAVTNKAASRHLVKHDSRSRTGSSSFMANTTSTVIDSRKNSYFSSVNNNQTEDSGEECEAAINTELPDYEQKSLPLLSQDQQDIDISSTQALPPYKMHEYDDLPKNLNIIREHAHADNINKDTPPQYQESSNTASLPKTVSIVSSASETNYDSIQLQPPENNQSLSNNEKDSPKILSKNAKGDIDHSSLAKVEDIIKKFEFSDSN